MLGVREGWQEMKNKESFSRVSLRDQGIAMPEKVMKPCSKCGGSGHKIIGGYQNECTACEGHGYTLVDKKTYLKELRSEVRDERYKK